MRSLLVAFLLLSAGLAGCLDGADEDLDANADDTNGEQARASTCSENHAERTGGGVVAPGEPLSVQQHAEEAPDRIDVSTKGWGVDSYTFTLERDGEQILTKVMDRSLQPHGKSWGFTDLEPGTYTLTAATDQGSHDLEIGLATTWTQSC